MENEDLDTLGKRVKARRQVLKLNQEQLAAAAGMGQGDISKIERGEIQQTTKVAHLARALRCDAYWLATGEGDPVAGTSFEGPILSAEVRQLLADLEDVPLQKRARLIQAVREAAADAREAAEHLSRRRRPDPLIDGGELFEGATNLTSRTAEEDARVERLRHEAERRTQKTGGVNENSPKENP